MAVARSLENVDYESLLYSSKIFANLAQESSELISVMGEAGCIDTLCRVI